MTGQPGIHGSKRSFSVSTALDVAAQAISTIREEDGLTWKDVGRVLGRGDDQASQYAKGTAEMGFTSFLLACKEWNGRFSSPVFELIGCKLSQLETADMSDNQRLTHLLHLAHLLSVALTDQDSPNAVDDTELKNIGSAALDNVARAVESLRRRLAKLEDREFTSLRLA